MTLMNAQEKWWESTTGALRRAQEINEYLADTKRNKCGHPIDSIAHMPCLNKELEKRPYHQAEAAVDRAYELNRCGAK